MKIDYPWFITEKTTPGRKKQRNTQKTQRKFLWEEDRLMGQLEQKSIYFHYKLAYNVLFKFN